MTTTTVRFDADLWAAIGLHAGRLGVGRATFIRDAVRSHLVRIDERERVVRDLFGHDLDRLSRRVERVETFIRRLARGGRA